MGFIDSSSLLNLLLGDDWTTHVFLQDILKAEENCTGKLSPSTLKVGVDMGRALGILSMM